MRVRLNGDVRHPILQLAFYFGSALKFVASAIFCAEKPNNNDHFGFHYNRGRVASRSAGRPSKLSESLQKCEARQLTGPLRPKTLDVPTHHLVKRYL
jgi:hypothetical protein